MEMLQTVLRVVAKATPSEIAALSERSGVSVHTILKLRNGQTTDPRISTLEPLYKAVTGTERLAGAEAFHGRHLRTQRQ